MLNKNQKNDLNIAKTSFESVLNDLISLHNNLGIDVKYQIRKLNDGLNALYDGLCLNSRYIIEKNDFNDIIRKEIY